MSSSAPENVRMLFEKMEQFITTKTVVGEPVYLGDIVLVPLVDVSFGMGAGFGSGGGRKETVTEEGGGGGGGMGAKMTPAAVVVIINGTVQLVNVKSQDSVNKLIDMVPGILSKFNFDSLFKKKEDKAKEDQTDIEE